MMRRASSCAAITLALSLASGSAEAVVISGEVQAVDAQVIITPQANTSPVVLRFYLPEGTRVKKGEVVLRIDPGNAASQIRTLGAQIEQAGARRNKEVAELKVKALDAQLALADAEAAHAVAKIDAAIPKALISGLDHDRHQGELDRAAREAALKNRELGIARAAVARRGADGQLEINKLQVQRDFHAVQERRAEVRADRDGIVRHGFNNNWIGGRIDEGSSTMPGSKAGEVVSGGAVRVRAWALEPDRRGLQVGLPVQLSFDALPGARADGRITTIAGAPDRRPEWGNGRYFQIDIDFDDESPSGLPLLLPGMSVRVSVDIAAKAAPATGTLP